MDNKNMNEKQNAANEANKPDAPGAGGNITENSAQNEAGVAGAIEYVIEDETKPMNILQRLTGIFLSPKALMENIKIYPKMLQPLIIFIFIGIAMALVSPRITQISTEELSLVMIERYGSDLLSAATMYTEETGEMVSMISAVSIALGSLTGPYINGFFGAVVLLVIAAIFRAKAKFMQYYSMYVHIAMLTSILSVISMIFMVMTNSSVDVLSLGMLMPSLSGNIFNVTYMALSAVSVANIWKAALVYIGVKTFSGCSSTKAALISIIIFLFSVALTAGMAAFWGVYYDFFNGMMGNVVI